MQFVPPPIRLSPAVPRSSRPRDIVFLGRRSTLKGLDVFLHAAVAILSDAATAGTVGDFIVIGPREGVSSAQSEDDILRIGRGWIGRRIHITGSLSQNEIRKCFAKAACAVFPHRVESYCYAAHEAFLAGVPLILSDTPAFRDHFEGDVDAIFFDGTISSLAQKIIALVGDTGLGQKLSVRRTAHLDRYSTHHYPSIIGRVVRHNGPPRVAYVGNRGDVSQSVSVPGLHNLQVIVLHSNRKPSASAAGLLDGLRASLPKQIGWIDLYPARGDSGFFICGRRMEAREYDGSNVVAQKYPLCPLVVFVDAERPPLASFLVAATAILARHSGVGCVVPSLARIDGTTAVGPASAAIETCYLPEIRHLGAVIRTSSGLTLAELSPSGGPSTELDLIVRARERNAIIVDWPMRSSAVHLPASLVFGPGDEGLRRQAWQASGFALTAFLTSLRRPQVPFRILSVHDRINHKVSGLIADSIHHPRRVFLLANCFTDINSSKTVTFLTIYSKYGSAQLPWSLCTFEGEWEVTHTAPSSSGRRTRTGKLVMDLSQVQEFDALVGPEEGTVLMIFNGRGVVLDLFSPTVSAARVSAEPLFDVADGTIFAARSLAGNSEAGFGETIDAPTGIVIALDRSSSIITRNLKLQHSLPIADLDLKRGTSAQSRGAIVRALMAPSNAYEVTLVGANASEIAADLLKTSPDAKVTVALPRSIRWRADDYRDIKAAIKLQQRHPQRLKLLCPDGVLFPLVDRLGGWPSDVATVLPCVQRRHDKLSGPIELLLGPGDGEIPTRGHIATAAAMVAQLAPTAVNAIVYQTSNPEVAPILRLFPTSAKCLAVDSMDQYIREASEAFVLLAPYPTGIIDGLGLLALERGGLIVTSTGALPLSDEALMNWLTVDYWEQSDLLADHIVRLIDNYSDVQNRLMACATVG